MNEAQLLADVKAGPLTLCEGGLYRGETLLPDAKADTVDAYRALASKGYVSLSHANNVPANVSDFAMMRRGAVLLVITITALGRYWAIDGG